MGNADACSLNSMIAKREKKKENKYWEWIEKKM